MKSTISSLLGLAMFILCACLGSAFSGWVAPSPTVQIYPAHLVAPPALTIEVDKPTPKPGGLVDWPPLVPVPITVPSPDPGPVQFFTYDPATGHWQQLLGPGQDQGEGDWSPGWVVRIVDRDHSGLDTIFVYNPTTRAAFWCYPDGHGGFSRYVRLTLDRLFDPI